MIGAARWRAMIAIAALASAPAIAQSTTDRPTYRSARFDEDWSVLNDPATRLEPFDAFKWLPLRSNRSWYATLGGELRERIESSRKPVFGLAAPARNDYVLQRVHLFADIHYGPNARSFVQIASGIAPGHSGTPPPTQANELDLLQAFGDLWFPLGNGDLTLRAGRQEMSFGSSRLVSVRESPNFRRSFEGGRAIWNGSSELRVDAFVAQPVAPALGIFSDLADPDQKFWGVYVTARMPGLSYLNIDIYYLGLDRRNARALRKASLPSVATRSAAASLAGGAASTGMLKQLISSDRSAELPLRPGRHQSTSASRSNLGRFPRGSA